MWSFRDPSCVKRFLHTSHWNGFSPVWTTLWRFRWLCNQQASFKTVLSTVTSTTKYFHTPQQKFLTIIPTPFDWLRYFCRALNWFIHSVIIVAAVALPGSSEVRRLAGRPIPNCQHSVTSPPIWLNWKNKAEPNKPWAWQFRFLPPQEIPRTLGARIDFVTELN